jgi:subtilisin-like proprotein convertase family protein
VAKGLGAGCVILCLMAGLAPGVASAATFANSAPITINDSTMFSCLNPDQVGASPYPSQIQVSGQQGSVSDANVTINGFTHSSPTDVRVLLTGPSGQTTLLMNSSGGTEDVSNATITFDDAAAAMLPDPIVGGTFKPSQGDTGCPFPADLDFPAPAPAAPYGTDLAGFNGTYPNGAWSLYVVDAFEADDGSISGGWSLDLAGVSPATPVTPPASSLGEDPKCAKLRKKLMRQRKKITKAGSDAKHSMIEANVKDTKRRLQKLACT